MIILLSNRTVTNFVIKISNSSYNVSIIYAMLINQKFEYQQFKSYFFVFSLIYAYKQHLSYRFILNKIMHKNWRL